MEWIAKDYSEFPDRLSLFLMCYSRSRFDYISEDEEFLLFRARSFLDEISRGWVIFKIQDIEKLIDVYSPNTIPLIELNKVLICTYNDKDTCIHIFESIKKQELQKQMKNFSIEDVLQKNKQLDQDILDL